MIQKNTWVCLGPEKYILKKRMKKKLNEMQKNVMADTKKFQAFYI